MVPLGSSSCSLRVAVCLSASVFAACTQPESSEREAMDAIATTRAAFWEAHSEGNAQALADLVTEDAVLWAPGMEEVRGRDAIRSAAEGMFAAFTIADFKIESQELQVHEPFAYELSTYSETLTSRGSQPSPVRGRYLIVWRRDSDGDWRVHRNMFHFVSEGH